MAVDTTRRDHSKTFTRLTTHTHQFRLTPFRGYLLEVEDEHFHHDSAVLLPNYPPNNHPGDGPSLGLAVLAECLKHQSANLQQSVLFAGHADTSGPDQYNLAISLKRAEAVLHAIMGERDPWIAICEGQHKVEDYQLILTWVADIYGWDCDPNGVDNVNGTDTQRAVKNFQTTYNQALGKSIGVDGTVGHDTWGAFFDLYMDMLQNLCETDDAGLEQMRSQLNFIGPKVVGCGENWPIEKPQRQNYRSQINRRVEILFFDPGQEPKLDCHPGTSCTPVLCEIYNLKMYRFTVIPVMPSAPKDIQVFLKLTYIGPEDAKTEHIFPPDFPVTVVWKDNSTHAAKVGKDGLLHFGVPRSQGSFTLQFDTADVYVSAGPAGSAGQDKTGAGADIPTLHQQGACFFKTPAQWTLKQSDWTAVAAAHYDNSNFVFNLPVGLFGATLGSSGAPEGLKLDPHWTYVRFEFFDRYFGHSDHNHKRINIPATLIDGWRSAPPAANPDTRSHWTIRDDQLDKAVHAVPWIQQFKDDRSADSKPDKDIQLGFQTAVSTFIISDSASARKIDAVTDADKLKPSADRLKLYDLPTKWKSQSYYTRFSDGTGEFFDKASTFEGKIKASTSADTPLLFSLDDIVMTDAAKQQVTLTANDNVAIFFHRFVHADEAGKTSPVGIYNFDDGATARYQTKLDMTGKYYIFDYPNWVRLVITQQNLWDTFAERTPEGGPNQVVGARAAVRWVDATSGTPPAATVALGTNSPPNMAASARTDKDFFSIQPFYEQRFNRTSSKYSGAGSTQQGTGRYDMAVLRCCDHEDEKEVFFVLHYLRILFNFLAPPANAPSQQAFMDNACFNISARWTGYETVANAQNTIRTQFLPQDDTKKIKGYVLWFLQPVPSTLANANTRAHFMVNVNAGAGRAFMASDKGYGEFGSNCDAPEGSYAVGSYTGAHEVGHGNSLPDEYCERWWGASYGELSFWCRLPGDPYDSDGRFDPGVSAALTQQDSGMMNGVVKMRNRYYWHSAEFARVVTQRPLKVKYDTYEDYRIPPHPNAPRLQYTNWPISDAVDSTQGPRGKSDLLAYAMGKDRYTCLILPHASDASPFDGVLVVMIKMQLTFQHLSAASVSLILPVLRSAITSVFNDKFMATGKVQTGSPQEWEFKKCQIRFSPRFAVTNPDASDAAYASHLAIVQAIGAHFFINVNHTTTPNTQWNSATGNQLQFEANFKAANWNAVVQSQFRNAFAQMAGFANLAAVTKPNLKPVVQKVVTTNGDVADII